MYEERRYRKLFKEQDLEFFQVIIKETDLYIGVDKATEKIKQLAEEVTLKYRHELETYIQENPLFEMSFKPIEIKENAPCIVKEMARVASIANVGPMASVAGTIAEFVGKELLAHTQQVIVENGGDIFLKLNRIVKIGIYAGKSKFSNKIALEIEPNSNGLGICTSSATVGPSVSLGKADACVVISESTALADACATAIGNMVKKEEDIDQGLALAQKINGLKGVLIIKDEQMGVWGDLKIVPLE